MSKQPPTTTQPNFKTISKPRKNGRGDHHTEPTLCHRAHFLDGKEETLTGRDRLFFFFLLFSGQGLNRF